MGETGVQTRHSGLVGVGLRESLLVWGLNSGYQAWCQVAVPLHHFTKALFLLLLLPQLLTGLLGWLLAICCQCFNLYGAPSW